MSVSHRHIWLLGLSVVGLSVLGLVPGYSDASMLTIGLQLVESLPLPLSLSLFV